MGGNGQNDSRPSRGLREGPVCGLWCPAFSGLTREHGFILSSSRFIALTEGPCHTPVCCDILPVQQEKPSL